MCEGDSDRAFYDEINRRLLRNGQGSDDAIFLNARNWQTTTVIAEPLRRAGVPAAVVLDLDALLSDESWPTFWATAGLNATACSEFGVRRAAAAATSRDLGRLGGCDGGRGSKGARPRAA